ncbi:hypothetical protein C8F04DRAFT_128977 [Mycena alexandri]|uniref:Uncharacterized protein n=1 Tax=Mycena alexandri TaxID=1745969 RepID=A0AAD6SD75_9AGAR|nr:hypothetical protein C8F04DRAFT_128977 [Mycena alexandri]
MSADILRIEREFCSNFKCCDAKFSDLHALFDHLENCHGSSDLDDLAFLDPSSTGTFALPSSSRKLKNLFTRVPLPPIPPLSPITSDSSSVSTLEPFSVSSSDSEISPAHRCPKPRSVIVPGVSPDGPRVCAAQASTSDIKQPRTPAAAVSTPGASPANSAPAKSLPPAAKHFMAPSFLAREDIYTPVAVPPTLRLEQPQDSASSWGILTPSSFYLSPALGYYPLYRTVPVPAPTPVLPHVPIPGRAQGVPQNVEVIDVDKLSTPPPPPRAGPSSAFPTVATTSWIPPPSPARFPPPPSLPTPISLGDSDSAITCVLAGPTPAVRQSCDAATLARASAAAASTLASLRHRFFSTPYPLPVNNVSVPAPTDSNDAAREEQVDDDAMGMVGVEISTPEEAQVVGSAAAAGATVSEGEEALVGAGDEDEDKAPNVENDASVDDDERSQTEAEAEDALKEKAGEVSGGMDEDLDDSDEEAESVDEVRKIPKPTLYLNDRPKLFVCPVPLCIKSYLNSNGLRYHAKKGTCVMENGKPCDSSLSLVDSSIILWPATAGATVSPAATTTDAVRAESGITVTAMAKAKTTQRRRPVPSRQSARLAAVAKNAPPVQPEVRGSVKARSKAKSTAKTKPAPTRGRARPTKAAPPEYDSYSDDSDVEMGYGDGEDGDDSD